MSFDDTRAWYGGGYYEEPPPPPPGATAHGGVVLPDTKTWLSTVPKPGATQRRAGNALVLGRFLPAHRGHAYLLARAAEAVEGRVYVVVSGSRGDFLDAGLRRDAVQALLPTPKVSEVVVARDVGRSGTPDGDAFWQPWLDWLAQRPRARECTTLVAADPQAERFAQLMKLDFVLVDRTTVGVSGTAIRRAPWKYWDDIAPALRAHFTSCVSLVGPEGAGKSYLARQLAAHYGTSAANEYTVDWLRGTGESTPAFSQLEGEIWNGVREAWRIARHRAFRFFIADTDHLTIALWARRLHDRVIKSEPVRPGLTLLMDDATPWSGPKERDEPEARAQMVVEFRRLLSARGWPFHVLSGPREGRFEQAVKHIDAWVRSNPMGH